MSGTSSDRLAAGTHERRGLHADGDFAWQAMVGGILQTIDGLRSLGVTGSCRETLASVQSDPPDILLLELLQPDGDGLALAQAVTRICPSCAIVALTWRRDEYMLHRTSSGFQAVLWKTRNIKEELGLALNALAAGKCYCSPLITGARERLHARHSAFFKLLSPTEQRLIPLYATGLTDERIAEIEGRKPSTVKWHRHRVLERLDLKSTVALLRWAQATGFVCYVGPAASDASLGRPGGSDTQLSPPKSEHGE